MAKHQSTFKLAKGNTSSCTGKGYEFWTMQIKMTKQNGTFLHQTLIVSRIGMLQETHTCNNT